MKLSLRSALLGPLRSYLAPGPSPASLRSGKLSLCSALLGPLRSYLAPGPSPASLRSGRRFVFSLLFANAIALPIQAGLHYSGEQYAQLPARWRGFLLDQRMLRTIASKPRPGKQPGPARKRYLQAAAQLQEKAGKGTLTADEAADLGVVLLRLGEVSQALAVLRPAQGKYSDHFRLNANLGTAWQMDNNLAQAAISLREAVRLAPASLKRAEQLHLRLVQLRARENRGARTGATGSQNLDNLFGVRYVGPDGKYAPGKLAEDQRKKLPDDAIALMQRLALWLPADARVLWQLAELAAVGGDVRTAAAMMDGCVTAFGLRHPDLRTHRLAMRAAATNAARMTRTIHKGHKPLFKPASSEPLVHHFDPSALPAIDPRGTNTLPWSVVTRTVVDRRYRPTFPEYLRKLDGKQVRLKGFVQPLGDEVEFTAFMLIEYPVGCWYCEMPGLTGIVLAEMPEGKTAQYAIDMVEVTGRLSLNSTDPENFLYTIMDARVKPTE